MRLRSYDRGNKCHNQGLEDGVWLVRSIFSRRAVPADAVGGQPFWVDLYGRQSHNGAAQRKYAGCPREGYRPGSPDTVNASEDLGTANVTLSAWRAARYYLCVA